MTVASGLGRQGVAIEKSFLIRPGVELTGPDRWEDIYGAPGLLDVEIGFGKDEFLLGLAEGHPDRNYLAMDFSRPRARSYLDKIARRGLENVRVIVDHAANVLSLCLGDGIVREYFVFCPDPWPKERHARHRLVAPWFAREVARTLVAGGRITFATDHGPYRDRIIEVMEDHGAFENLLPPPGYGDRPRGFDSTIFERRWVDRGRNVHYMQFVRGGER